MVIDATELGDHPEDLTRTPYDVRERMWFGRECYRRGESLMPARERNEREQLAWCLDILSKIAR